MPYALQNQQPVLLARPPDRNAGVLSAGGDAPVLRNATALTAPSWNRSTFSAAPEASDQRMTVVSKLPEIAWLPSGEMAIALTGPPWPRSCAPAGKAAQHNVNATRRSLACRNMGDQARSNAFISQPSRLTAARAGEA